MNSFAKYPVIMLALVFSATVFVRCSTQKSVQQTEYNIPATASEEYKALLTARLDKGKTLYILYCTDCHGVFSEGKDSIPNFSKEQIDNYDALFVKKDPKSHAVARKLSQEQIDYVLTFLRLRKQS